MESPSCLYAYIPFFRPPPRFASSPLELHVFFLSALPSHRENRSVQGRSTTPAFCLVRFFARPHLTHQPCHLSLGLLGLLSLRAEVLALLCQVFAGRLQLVGLVAEWGVEEGKMVGAQGGR